MGSAAFCSCHQHPLTVTDNSFIDSQLQSNNTSLIRNLNEQDLVFWKKRSDSMPASYTDANRYAAMLARRFHLKGDIHDLHSADSIVHKINSAYREQEAGPLRTLAVYAIQQHKFAEAGQFVDKALALGSERYSSELLNFDVAFDLGQYDLAKNILQRIRSANEYGYYFRKARFEHYAGNLELSTTDMRKAADLAGDHIGLKQAALSNLADLYLHAADVEQAATLYRQSLRLDAGDLHSLMALGWIALAHDRQDSLAEKIFLHIRSYSQSPDVLLKLAQVAQFRGDSTREKAYAQEFENIVTNSVYGNMYNKYLIDLYTGILQQPAKAVQLAEKELTNRRTAQTYSWYAWALYSNHQHNEALKIYDQFVSGKPLEGPELFYMGEMMKGMGKGYNATAFFKAAYQNRYDLGINRIQTLEKDH